MATGFDKSTKKAAGKALSAALMGLLDANSGALASYVNFGGAPVKTESVYDIADQEVDLVMTSPDSSTPGGVVKWRSRIIGPNYFNRPAFGPLAKCWYRLSAGAFEDVLPGESEIELGLGISPPMLMLVDGAKARGFDIQKRAKVHASVSAAEALSAFSPTFGASVFDKIERDDVRTSAIFTLQGGAVSEVEINGGDIVRSFERADIHLFEDADQAEDLEAAFRDAVFTGTYQDLGEPVEVKMPAPETIIEVAGRDDIDDSKATCAAAEA